MKHSISYKTNIIRQVGKISLTAENIGNDAIPKYKLEAKVSDLNPKYDLTQVVYIFYRKIEGIDDDYREIARLNEPLFIDEPFANMQEMTKSKVYYKVIGKFPDGRTLDSTNGDNLYEDSYEFAEEKKGFPAYGIALIAVLGAALIAGGGFLTYKLLAKKSVEVTTLAVSDNPEVVKNYAGEKSYEKVASTSIRKRRIQNRPIIPMENNN